MPTYEYVCKRCGENFEVFQSFSEKPLKKHPDCGGDLQKVFHARGIVFKGSGFYATDAKGTKSAKPQTEKSSAKTASSSSSSDSSSSDSSSDSSSSSD